jgi:hypothetical protein
MTTISVVSGHGVIEILQQSDSATESVAGTTAGSPNFGLSAGRVPLPPGPTAIVLPLTS